MPRDFKAGKTDSPIGEWTGIGENNFLPCLYLYYNDGSSDVLGEDFRPRSRSRPRFCIFDYENEDDDEDDVVAARVALCLSVFICG
jgi:hypothetical protein